MLASCSALERFPENLTVVERTKRITLKCEAPPHAEVTWKKDGEGLLASRELTLEDVDQPNAGNYTCWHNGTTVTHTYLVISEKDQSPIFSNTIQCRARTFDGIIICSWQTRGAAIFKVKHCRRNLENECSLMEYSNSGIDHHYNFTMKNYSPYEEEYHPIMFIVEAISSVSYQKLQTTFYMEDIIKPDPPQNITVTLNRKTMNISWQYPCNWIEPHSYFPLHFEIEYKPKRNSARSDIIKVVEEEGLSKQITVRGSKKLYLIHIKAKDRFLNSPWSEWSDWIESRLVRV
ncbi:interleukin-12 subunit beta-like [Mustelus asterias]